MRDIVDRIERFLSKIGGQYKNIILLMLAIISTVGWIIDRTALKRPDNGILRITGTSPTIGTYIQYPKFSTGLLGEHKGVIFAIDGVWLDEVPARQSKFFPSQQYYYGLRTRSIGNDKYLFLDISGDVAERNINLSNQLLPISIYMEIKQRRFVLNVEKIVEKNGSLWVQFKTFVEPETYPVRKIKGVPWIDDTVTIP